MTFDLLRIDWTSIGSIATAIGLLIALLQPIVAHCIRQKQRKLHLRRYIFTYLTQIQFSMSDIMVNKCNNLGCLHDKITEPLNRLENIYPEIYILTKDEQRLFGNLLIMLKDSRSSMDKAEETIVESVNEYIQSYMELFKTYGISL